MKTTHTNGLEIAVVGMAVRLPRSHDVDGFFDLLCAGEELIRPIDEATLRREGVSEAEFRHPSYVSAAGFLDRRFDFDAEFFGYRPREAEFMDPQLRLLHECAFEALDAAGCDPALGGGPVGVYVGSSQNMHWLRAVGGHVGDKLSEIYDLKMVYQREFFATRLAYRLNLKGPAIGLDTTCSTSLVAVHMAAQGLLSGDCDVAVAGGACVSPRLKGYMFHEGMIQSPDGHCRPFDAQARGTVPGQGVGIVVLKRLDDAIADGNPIHAVLKSSAINNDGNDKVGYTAPSVAGQSRAIRAALSLAEVGADTIDFVECHGTATRIGDPIEVEALVQAYGTARAAAHAGPCLIGSVKSNLGHLDAAAGIVGFIKAVQVVRRGMLPGSLHYTHANPMIDFARGAFAVNRATTALARSDRPLRGGVSSFGIGGTNAHAIVEEYVERRVAPADRGRPRILPLSAKTPEALRRHAAALAGAIDADASLGIDRIAATRFRARASYGVRHALVATDRDDARRQLLDIARDGGQAARGRGIVFMFSGQGAQYPGMTRGLYRGEPRYRAHVDECLALLPDEVREGVSRLLKEDAAPDTEAMALRTDLAQPFLFVVEYSLARTLMDWGIRPVDMIGHSLGEFVAACLAGVFTLRDALGLVVERGRLMGSAAAGAMLSVRLGEAGLADILRREGIDRGDDPVELAAVNSTSLTVAAGSATAIDRLQALLEAAGLGCTRLKTGHAFHSRAMEPLLDAFRARVAATPRHPPAMAYRSNLDGAAVDARDVLDADYWCRHMRSPVRFADALAPLLADGRHAFVELGPGNALCTFVRQHAGFDGDGLCVQAVRHPRDGSDDEAMLLRAVAALYADGATLDPASLLDDVQGPFAALPPYSFVPKTFARIAMGDEAAPAQASAQAEAPRARPMSHPRPDLRTPYREGDTDAERTLCGLWAEVFRLDRVGIDDDFFELGGHSLLATRLLADIGEAFGVEVSLNTLFAEPHVRGLAAQIAAGGGQRRGAPPLVVVDRSLPIPLSFQQRRLWMIDRLGGGSAQYNMPSPFILNGALDIDVLRASLDRLVARHETLRTVFREVDGEPVQVVLEQGAVALTILDLGGLADGEREARQAELVRNDAMRAFDLSRDPPLRVTLAVLAPRRHLLLFNLHHIVSDGWSEVLIVREFAELYRAGVAGESARLPSLTLQYADFAAWQRGWLAGDTLATELDFWRERLAGLPPVHNLPLDRPRPAEPGYAGAVHRRKLPLPLLDALRGLSQGEGATLFMTLQTAFALLLARWSASDDIVMGTPVAGRSHKALESLVGFFVNTLLLRNDLSGNVPFRALLARTKAMALSAFEHQYLPFEMLVDELAPSRSRNHAPLFQIMFALQNYERGGLVLEGLELEKVEQVVAARFDLSLITAEAEDGLFTDWHYDTDLFDEATIARMAAQFEVLLSSVLASPDTPAHQLDMLAPDEVTTLLVAWQRHTPADPAPLRIEECFRQSAVRHAGAEALVVGGEAWTYRALDEQASRLAHVLMAAGAGPGRLVALCLPTGSAAVLGMFAALRCGAAYIPMDPGYPVQRLAAMLAVARPAVLLIDRAARALDGLPVDDAIRVIDLADPATYATLSAAPATPPVHAVPLSVDDPAYVIFTSGSSGEPKGVVVTHRQMAASLASRHAVYEERAGTALLLSSLSFDSSVPTVFLTLLDGGRLALCDDDQRRDTAAIAGLVDRLQVSHILCLPSVYAAYLEFVEGSDHTGASLRSVILAAEMFTAGVRRAHFAHPTIRAALYNEYGPTECSVWSTYYRCLPGLADAQVPIGHSPGHARLYVLDAAGGLVPIGVEGELYIGGDGVASGYLGQPGLTAERFLPDPFSTQPGARMYRSGDRVRWRHDGELDILGRMDRQVKLRGYRIEPGDIDASLEQHPSVARAVTRVLDGALVACVSLAPDAVGGFDTREARRFLAGRLPDFMLPQRVMTVAELPLLPNGKVDTARLPVPGADVDGDAQRIAPRTAMERRVLDAWCEVLRIDPPSVDESFFAVGGDSILLLKLSASLRRQGLSFAAKAFYAEPTVEALARLVEETGDDGDDAAAQGEQRLHPMQSWFLLQGGEEPWHYNQSVIVELRDTAFPFTAAPEVVAALLERHDALRLGFARDGEGSWRAAYRELTPAMVAACIHDIEVTGEDIEREASRIQRGLSLDGPLFRLARLRLPDGGARLLIVVHHLVVDGVSWRVLLHDLDMAFRSAAQGQPAALPPRTATYQRAVARLEELAVSPAARDELPYWREVLRARLPALRGGAEHDDVMADEASEAIAFPSELTDALLTGSARAGGLTIGEALVSALRIAFRAWRGADTLGLVMEGHGRSLLGESLDVGETVGWFTASYPVAFAALDASADTTAWLRDTRDVLRGVPAGGERFVALQCFGGAGTDLDDGAFRRDAVRFNYLGQFDQALHDESAFAIAGERSGENISPRQRRDAPLAFDGMVSGGRLRFSLKYNRRRHAGEDMRRLLDAFGAALVEVAACWRSAALSGIGRADARWLDVDDEEIAEWNRRWPEVVAAYPATPGQQGMLVRSLRDGHGERASFVNQLIFDIQGRLDEERLRSAWEGFAQRHDVFRTAFVPLRRGGMAQLLLAADAVRLPCRWLDLSEASPAEQVSAIDTAIAADRGLGFDLGEAPLSRVTVWRLGEDRHRVLWSTHHALVDGWSIPLAFRSLLDAYTAGPGASRSVHPGFREYVAWRQSRDMRADREYWRGRLAGLEAPCLLAPRRAGADTSAALVRDIRLEAADVDGLERLARSCSVTVYSVLQCAWAWMLRLYTGRNSVCFGSVASGRPDDLPGADATIGLFINTLPVVGTIDEALPLRAWLQEIQGTQADAQAFGTLALAEILPLAPGGGQAALFDSVLVYENYPVDSIRETGDAAGPRIVGLRSDESTGTGLTVAMMPGPGKVLGVRFMFHDGEFPVAFVDRLADQFIQLLRGMPALAEGSVGELGDLLVEAPAPVAAADAQVASLSDDELLALLSQLEADTE